MVQFDATTLDSDFITFISPKVANKNIIALDGHEGTGKSEWFSALIAQARGNSSIVHIDDYVKKQKTAFGFYILKSQKNLYKKINSSSSTSPVIIEGILVKEKLKNLGLTPDLWVYIKRIVNYGWQERDWLDKTHMKDYPPTDLSFHLQHPRLRQIYKYHMKYEPQIKADIVINVSERLYT